MAYRICTKCVMDTSDPSISFDECGICNHCRTYEAAFRTKTFFGVRQEGSLDDLVKSIKSAGESKPYDCIVGLSGGVDSSYVAYLVAAHGLRPLAVHVDNGWNSELAVANIEQICSRLKIDLFTEVLNWSEFRSIQVAFLRAGTPDAEIPSDHAIVATMYRQGKARGLPVLAGYNVRTESHMPAAWSQGHYDSRYIRDVNRQFGRLPLRTFPTINWLQAQRYVRGLVNILNYVNYDKKAAMAVIESELGWRNYGRKHAESIYTKFYQEYYLPHRFGFDKRRSHLSSLVCAKQISRESALAELQQPPCNNREAADMLEYVLKKLQLSPAEYDAIVAGPKRSFEDFASYARLQRVPGAGLIRMAYRRTLKRWM